MSDSDAPLNLLLRAARWAARGLARDLGELEQLQNSPAGAADFARRGRDRARETLRKSLLDASPAYGWTDDREHLDGRDPNRRWIAEPVSGFGSFAHGAPGFALAVGYVEKGVTSAAIVLDPATGELFSARRGGGASREQVRARVSGRARLEGALIGAPDLLAETDEDRSLAHTDGERLLAHGARLRSAGSAVLDLAWVAAGRFDGAWMRGGLTTGARIAALLILEAGGTIRLPEPGTPTATLAANPRLFEPLSRTVAHGIAA